MKIVILWFTSIMKTLRFNKTNFSAFQLRLFSSQSKFMLNEDIEKKIENNELKPRKHPGLLKHSTITLPKWITDSINLCLEDSDRASVLNEKTKFCNYLFSRLLPTDEEDLHQKYIKVEEKFLKNKTDNLSVEEINELRSKNKHKIMKILKKKTYFWAPIEYNQFKSLVYMTSRSAAEYSVLVNILNEIKIRDKKFDPNTVFDFGSGMGSVLWATTLFWKNIKEYVGIDISSDFNNYFHKIFEKSPVKVQGIFLREYLPLSQLKYDLVVSAYSLFELHDSKSRLEVISKLWKKTSQYLIIIEQGTNAGFKVVNEAREFVLHLSKNVDDFGEAYVFAPCPHDLKCPRFEENKYPCNFKSTYQTLSFFGPPKQNDELYTYVVLKKGQRSESDNWCRLVRPTLPRGRHAYCYMCTAEGKLVTEIFTKNKSGKSLYKCARNSRWGDRIPLKSISQLTNNNENNGENENLKIDSDDIFETDNDNEISKTK